MVIEQRVCRRCLILKRSSFSGIAPSRAGNLLYNIALQRLLEMYGSCTLSYAEMLMMQTMTVISQMLKRVMF